MFRSTTLICWATLSLTHSGIQAELHSPQPHKHSVKVWLRVPTPPSLEWGVPAYLVSGPVEPPAGRCAAAQDHSPDSSNLVGQGASLWPEEQTLCRAFSTLAAGRVWKGRRESSVTSTPLAKMGAEEGRATAHLCPAGKEFPNISLQCGTPLDFQVEIRANL